jgi:ADP-ribose pyrophosphatase YjhB (NUDIX family)
MPFDWLKLAQRLEAIAQTGLSFTENHYDRERYDEIRKISHEIFNQYTGQPVEKIHNFFTGENFYPTPKVDVRGVVFRRDRILLVREKLDAKWSLPGGWADIGYSPHEVVVKEVQEESCLEVKPGRLLALLDKRCHDHPPSPLYVYKLFILCFEIGGELGPGMETLDAGFFSLNDLPPLSLERITYDQVKLMFSLYKNEKIIPVVD